MLGYRAGSWMLVAVVVVLMTAVTVASARSVSVELRDGRRVSGQLVGETGQTITVAISGIETTFPRDQVVEMEMLDALAERYEERRGEVDDEDWSGRYEIARWLYDQRTGEGYELALVELGEILEHRPDDQRAQLLRQVVQARMDREGERPSAEEAAPEAPMEDDAERPMEAEAGSADGSATEERVVPGAPELLTERQVALIRAFEVDLTEQPRVVVPREVMEEVLERYRDDPVLERFLGRDGRARLHRLAGYEQLGILFDLRAREYYDDVIIRSEPATLREFRMRIHPNYVVRYCGQCHGGGAMEAPGLTLLTDRLRDESTAYTNLMVLRRTTYDDRPMIYQNDPLRSPLVQMGLPREEAVTPHPEVRGWRPHFTGMRDRRLEEMLRWVSSLYGSAGEDYPIEFEIPGEPMRPEGDLPDGPEPMDLPDPAEGGEESREEVEAGAAEDSPEPG